MPLDPKVHTRMFRCGNVGLKGEIVRRLLAHLDQRPQDVRTIDATSLLATLSQAVPE